MSDFLIPKGKEFTFTVNVKERDSYIAQDLTNLSAATFEVFKKDDSCSQFTATMTVEDAINGVLKCTVSSTNSDLLEVARGGKVDGYYLQSLYYGDISISFTDATLPMHVLLEDVYVSPSGVTCA